MTGISKAAVYLSVTDLLTKKYIFANTKKISAPENNILDKIRLTDPQKADALEKQLTDNKQVAAELQNSKGNAAQERKTAAAEKVRRIKEQIKLLKMMGGDPKIIARQIAGLARDLAVAVREYASACSMSPQDRAASADTETSASGNNVIASNTVESITTDSGTAVSAGVSVTAVSGETSMPGRKNETVENETQEQQHPLGTGTGAALAESSRYQETQRQKIKDDLQKEVTKIKDESARSEENREFAREVLLVAAQLKLLARQTKQRLHQAGDRQADQDIKRTDQALAEVEKTIPDITGNHIISLKALA